MSSSTALAPLVPAVRGACRRAWKAFASISSVRARQASGTHLFRIDGFSTVNAMVLEGTSIDSGRFHAGGRKWKLRFYPNGKKRFSWSTGEPTVSVQLRLEEGKEAMAGYKVSILDRAGKPAYTAAVEPGHYRAWSFWRPGEESIVGESGHLVSIKELRRSADRVVDDDDCLNVLCEVSVLKLDSESVPMWYVRQAFGRFR